MSRIQGLNAAFCGTLAKRYIVLCKHPALDLTASQLETIAN